MGRILFTCAVVFSLAVTASGAEVLVSQVEAAQGLKSSVITLVIGLGLALLGPALLCALWYWRPFPAGPRNHSN
jgi:hypothetical protein